jgi:hypothetical protein
MKRIAGSFLLLAGLGGCVSFNNPPDGKEKLDIKAPSPFIPPASSPQAQVLQPTAGPNLNVPTVDGRYNWPGPSNTISSPAAPPGVPSTSPLSPPRQMPPPPDLPPPTPVTVPATPPVSDKLVAAISPHSDPEPIHPVNSTPEPPEPKILPGKMELSCPPSAAAAPKPTNPLPPVPLVHDISANQKVAKMGTPLMRLVNTKRITLNFEINDVGPSGLSTVELWYTRDCREWKKYDAPTKTKSYVIEVDDEGMYGFTLVARSGIGLGKEPPAAGDQPQVWVIVDLTKPEVHLTEVTPNLNPKKQEVAIKWSASDKNLGRQPISLSYAEKPDGPWKLLAGNLENSGQYVWQPPSDAPGRFFVKVEATDLAGNVGSGQSPKAVLLDTRIPSVSIVNVEGNTGQ